MEVVEGRELFDSRKILLVLIDFLILRWFWDVVVEEEFYFCKFYFF